MNAYELADELENYVWMNPNNNRDYCKEVKDKLRQQANDVGSLNARLKRQADRIAELEKVIFDRNVDLAKTINRITELENQLDKFSHHEAMAHQGGYELGKASQIKELSDEEILQFRDKVPYSLGSDLIDFARAILKKANEK